MNAAADDLLCRASRCFLGVARSGRPEVAPTACWYDGDALWMSAVAASLPALVSAPEHAAVAYVPPADLQEPGVVVGGRARVYSLRDPLRLALHSATISAAMAALAAHNAGAVLGAVGHAARGPHRWWPQERVVVRLVVERRTAVDPPDVDGGVAPALPTVVPSDVRRALAGLRRLALVSGGDESLRVTPAVWGAGYSLRTPPTSRPVPGTPVVATVDPGERQGLGWSVGLVLHGEVDANGRLVPQRATSWSGDRRQSAAVSRPAGGGVVMPD